MDLMHDSLNAAAWLNERRGREHMTRTQRSVDPPVAARDELPAYI